MKSISKVRQSNFDLDFIKTFAPNSLRDSACEYFIIITTYFHFFYFVSLSNSCTFIFVLILDLIMTLSERRNVIAFLNL